MRYFSGICASAGLTITAGLATASCGPNQTHWDEMTEAAVRGSEYVYAGREPRLSAVRIGPERDSLPAPLVKRIQEATGFELVSDAEKEAKDSTIAILSITQPRVRSEVGTGMEPADRSARDSLFVYVDWVSLTGGDGGGGHGKAYRVDFDCSVGPPCKFIRVVSAGSWN